jgi:hypothetical protein
VQLALRAKSDLKDQQAQIQLYLDLLELTELTAVQV